MAPHPIYSWIYSNAHLAVRPLAEVERETILQAMILCRGNVFLAAERLGITRKTLYRKLAEYLAEEKPAPYGGA